MLTWTHGLLVFAAGLVAGTMNTVVGSGTLVTFPTLLAVGLPPVTANVSNTVGLVAGGVTGSWGYRRELAGQRSRLLRLAPMTITGAVAGGILLLTLPPGAFKAIVPVLILIGCLMVLLQPKLQPLIARRARPDRGAWWVAPGVLLCGVYGGYFGAAQGVLMMAVFGLGLSSDLQRMNGLKNVLTTIANLVAAIVFVIAAHVNWAFAGLVALGSLIGGVLGSTFGRRLPPWGLRGLIVVIGLIAVGTIWF